MDLTTIIIAAGLFLGLVVGDAALFGDPLQVQISIPPKVAETGFTQAAAEQVFAAEVAGMGQALSIVKTPSVHMNSRPRILAALGKPLNLDNVVVAIQSQAGIEVVTVQGIVLAEGAGKRLDMVTVINMPHEVPVQLRLSDQNGDAPALIQHAAEQAMEWVAPYRLALTQFGQGLSSDPALLARARDTATRAVARPWVPARATEQVMLHNLLAMLALLNGENDKVQAELQVTDTIPDADAAAHGVVEVNRSFLDVAAGRTAEAERHYQTGMTLTADINLNDWDAKMSTLGALVAWSRGDLAQAEAMLRRSIADMPQVEESHAYLAQLLETRGDTAGAAAERTAAANFRRLEVEFPALPQSLFWVDPVHGGMRRRS